MDILGYTLPGLAQPFASLKSKISSYSPAVCAGLHRVEFAFEDHPLHCVTHEGKPWFVASHICAAVGITNPSQAVAALDDDEKAEVCLTYTSSTGTVQRRRTLIVSEPGVYFLLLRSRGATKPGTKAHRFRKWVTGTVLPTLRETGSYTPQAPSPEQNAAWMVSQIGRLMPLTKLLELLYPLHEFGSIASNGQPRKGFRRAAFVAAGDRPGAARDFNERVIVLRYLLKQLEFPLGEGRAA